MQKLDTTVTRKFTTGCNKVWMIPGYVETTTLLAGAKRGVEHTSHDKNRLFCQYSCLEVMQAHDEAMLAATLIRAVVPLQADAAVHKAHNSTMLTMALCSP